MAKTKKTKALKEVKKRWMAIIAPELFNKAYLGESLMAEPKSMLNKCIIANLMDLTKNIKQQNVDIKFKVVEIQDNEARTEMIGYEMNQATIKRYIRKNLEKVEDSFLVSTSDSKVLRVKPMVITRSNTKNSVKTAMRKYIKSFLIKEIATMTYEDFIKNVIGNKIQHGLIEKINKIYPTRMIAIQKFYIVENVKGKKLPTAEELPTLEKEKEEELPAEEEAAEETEETADEDSEEATEDDETFEEEAEEKKPSKKKRGETDA